MANRASNILYKIARVFNWIEIIVLGLLAIAAIATIIWAPDIAASDHPIKNEAGVALTADETVSTGITMLVSCLIGLAISIAVLYYANKALKDIKQNPKDNKPHIIMIIAGIFSNILYLIGGIVALLSNDAASKEKVEIAEPETAEKNDEEGK